jgi:catechol 2,3-dioxygenase
MGHVHLQVADIDSTVAFLRDIVGFELMTSVGRQAVFLAAGGYHHHVGANTWSSRGAPPAPETMAHLENVTFALPDQSALDDVRDRARHAGLPSGETPFEVTLTDPSSNRLIFRREAKPSGPATP